MDAVERWLLVVPVVGTVGVFATVVWMPM